MTKRNNIKTIQHKSRMLEHKFAHFLICLTPARLFARNRHGVSAVISNLILIGAVITMGIVALAYARSTSIGYQTDYAKSIGADISKLKESLTFEYAQYDSSSKQLTVYVLNAGSVDVQVNKTYVNDYSIAHTPTITTISGSPLANFTIGKGSEAKMVINLADFNHLNSGINAFKLTTRSLTNFAYSFSA